MERKWRKESQLVFASATRSFGSLAVILEEELESWIVWIGLGIQ